MQMRYQITRQGSGREETMQVDATARLLPADVLEVEAQLAPRRD